MNEALLILYEDAELIVCHKPAGLPVQSAKVGQKDMVSILNNRFADIQKKGKEASTERSGSQAVRKETPSVYVVHRLDQPVEGVLVFAKTKRAAAELSRQISGGSMKKIYQAVCCVADKSVCKEKQAAALSGGRLSGQNPCRHELEEEKAYCLVDYLVKGGRTNLSSVTEQGRRDAKRAELVFQIKGKKNLTQNSAAFPLPGEESSGLCPERRYLLAEIELKTGRHHQIRVQMAHAGLPLYGDQKYNKSWREFLTETDRKRTSGQESGKISLALCAVSLTFVHPVTKKKMEFRTRPETDIFSLFL